MSTSHVLVVDTVVAVERSIHGPLIPAIDLEIALQFDTVAPANEQHERIFVGALVEGKRAGKLQVGADLLLVDKNGSQLCVEGLIDLQRQLV